MSVKKSDFQKLTSTQALIVCEIYIVFRFLDRQSINGENFLMKWSSKWVLSQIRAHNRILSQRYGDELVHEYNLLPIYMRVIKT